MHPVDLAGIAIDVNTGLPLVVLQERDDPHRVLPIFVGAPEASAIAIAAAGQRIPQPLVHDVMAALVTGLDGTVDAVEVNGIDNGVFTAAIKISGPRGSSRIGSRPSDALALAVRSGAPVFVSEAVLDVAGHLPEPVQAGSDQAVLDDAAIDAAVDSFRSFLDDVDPADFTDASDTTAASDTSDTSDDPQGDSDEA